MTNAADNAKLAIQRVELSMNILGQARSQLATLRKSIGQAHLRMEEAKLPLYAAAGMIQEGQGEGHRLAQLTMSGDNRTKEISIAILNMKDAIDDLLDFESSLKSRIEAWEATLRQ